MKFVGKPYEGKLHVRFDEGEWLSTFYSTILTRGHARGAWVSGSVFFQVKREVCMQNMQSYHSQINADVYETSVPSFCNLKGGYLINCPFQ
jgi:hypothetical protein